MRGAPRPRGAGAHRAWLVALVLVITMATAAWWFLIRGAAPSSAFVSATERYVAAVDRIRSGAANVSRFLDLPSYQDDAAAQIEVLKHEETFFKRMARKESGEAKRIAEEAAIAAGRGWYSAGWFRNGIVGRRLTTANRANAELGAAVADLKLLAEQWKKLSG